MTQAQNPFHAGEIEAQRRAGVPGVAQWAGGFIRDRMPDQHRAFFAQLPFVVLAGADAAGDHWVSLIDGPDGFIQSPDARALTFDTPLAAHDPLGGAIAAGTDVGMLGIEHATRRRNRLSGATRATPTGFAIDVRQSFGNCPQYIHERDWRRVDRSGEKTPLRGRHLSDGQIARIRAADTLFIGTGQRATRRDHASNGFDASHRGGAPGFVEVVNAGHLRIPDYAGNNFFNTIGNLLENPRIGLVFVDFESGGLLHLTGRATVAWDADDSADAGALRMIDVTVEGVLDRPGALSLRWSRDTVALHPLRIVDKVVESATITSFYLAPADGGVVAGFRPGQHLPVELDVPGQPGKVRRSYSLSGAPGQDRFRISVKREPKGVASRYLHDTARVGDTIDARAPSGDFVMPAGTAPLVLVSAGVGLTPMVSMLHAAAAEGQDRAVYYVHGARNGFEHAMRDEVDALVAGRAGRLLARIFYSRPEAHDRIGDRGAPSAGRITAARLIDLNAGPQAQYMLCGPAPFLADIRTGLEALGVPEAHIHFETFGPTG